MLLPTVAIIGRPNVGKSSLFNRLVGKPISIVDPTAGVTRDRILHEVRRDDLRFDLIDTGGIGLTDEAKLAADVEIQVDRAITTADLIIFLVDGRSGIAPMDSRIAQRLRAEVGRVLVVVNKLDDHTLDDAAHEFFRLNLGDPLPVSAEHSRGIADLLEAIGKRLPKPEDLAAYESAASAEGRIKICLAGRRNVGKSSITNRLVGEERVIVADLPGTTRDAVDVRLDAPEGKFLLIDTAGLRKKKQLHEDLEFYAACRTERAIGRADVVFLILDASDEIGTVDKKLAHFCESAGKPTVLVVNKWDLARQGGGTPEAYRTWLTARLPGLAHAPMVVTCALTGSGLSPLLKLAIELHHEAGERVPTKLLNEIIAAAVQRRRPRAVQGGRAKIYYVTQAEVRPPTFVCFVNRADWVEAGYGRYLENFLRPRTPFSRVPVSFVFKARDSKFHEQSDETPRITAGHKADRDAHLIVPKSSKRRHGGSRPKPPAPRRRGKG